mgnify:FL=1
MIRCLKTDLYRALFNFKFVIIILCIAIIPFLGASGTGGIDLSILAKGDSIFDCLYYALVMSHFGIMVFIFTALTFSDCLCDDLNYKNYLYSVTRSGKNTYILSKIITVVVSVIVSFMLGMILYAFMSKTFFRFNWYKTGGDNLVLSDLMDSNLFKGLVEEKKYVTIFMIMILFQSLLYCITSLCSMLASLYIKNRLLVLCVPCILITVGNYIIIELIPNFPGYIYVYMINSFQQKTWVELIVQIIAPTLGIIIVLGMLITIKFRRNIVD